MLRVVAEAVCIFSCYAERRMRLKRNRQAHAMIDAWFARNQTLPYVLFFPEHNHISQIAHLNAAGTGDRLLSDRLAEFINTACQG